MVVSELAGITALYIPTVFKPRLKLMYAKQSTIITYGSCITCPVSQQGTKQCKQALKYDSKPAKEVMEDAGTLGHCY